MRWEEEYQLLEYEMEWTTRWFAHQAQLWDSRASAAHREVEALAEHLTQPEAGTSSASLEPIGPIGAATHRRGATAYAHRKSAMYKSMAHEAQVQFLRVNPLFIPIVP